MILISQEEDKAVESKDILYLFVTKALSDPAKTTLNDNSIYKLTAMLRGQQITLPYGAIVIYQEKSLVKVKKMFNFFAEKIFKAKDGVMRVSEVQKQI